MDIDRTIYELVSLPLCYNSEYDTVKATGYFDLHEKISTDIIREYLEKNPEWFKRWIQYSEDQRCTPSWYFMKTDEGNYMIGYVPRESTINTHEKEYDNPFEACADYIKKIVEQIREIGNYKSRKH
jgi:hypothetical protein